MDDVKINTSKTISLALGADPDSSTVNATLYHEFADSRSPCTRRRSLHNVAVSKFVI
jgi:hypothetical protein